MSGRVFFCKLCCSRSYYYVSITQKTAFNMYVMIFCNFPRDVPRAQKSPNFELWQASRLSVFIGFHKNFGFCLYLQHILGATKSGMSCDPLQTPPPLRLAHKPKAYVYNIYKLCFSLHICLLPESAFASITQIFAKQVHFHTSVSDPVGSALLWLSDMDLHFSNWYVCMYVCMYVCTVCSGSSDPPKKY